MDRPYIPSETDALNAVIRKLLLEPDLTFPEIVLDVVLNARVPFPALE
nr:MAG TPA: hypothetical protein [Caudoviricetes sp.]